jgi:hypothetical protein
MPLFDGRGKQQRPSERLKGETQRKFSGRRKWQEREALVRVSGRSDASTRRFLAFVLSSGSALLCALLRAWRALWCFDLQICLCDLSHVRFWSEGGNREGRIAGTRLDKVGLGWFAFGHEFEGLCAVLGSVVEKPFRGAKRFLLS